MVTMRIPIYPSAGVLFPGEVQAFSRDRDSLRLLLDYARERQLPIGIVHASSMQGSGLSLTGTTAELVDGDELHVEESNSFLMVGQARFQMQQIHQDRSFLEATVDIWPWNPKPRPAWNLVETVGIYLQRYAQAFTDILPPALIPETLVRQTAALGILAAALMQIPGPDKQQLLETRTSENLLAAVAQHLRVQVPIAERLYEMQPYRSACCERIFLN